MNNDLSRAKSALSGHSVALCKGSSLLVSDGRGIRPMLDFIERNVDLKGYSFADIVVGKAAACLFVYGGITSVYADVLSESALEYLRSHAIEAEYGVLVKSILNRKGDGVCPMEACVANIDDANEAFIALKTKVAQMRKG